MKNTYWNHGVDLKNIAIWNTTLPIDRLRGKVSFVPDDQNYGSFLQGSVKRISRSNYQTIIVEHGKMDRKTLQH